VRGQGEQSFKGVFGQNEENCCEVASITKTMTFYSCVVYLRDHGFDLRAVRVRIPLLAETIEGYAI
jgi:hypothetical protein